MCLLTNERYKINWMGFLLGCLGHAQGVVLGGCWGGGGLKLKFSEHGHVAYQIKGDDQ